MISKVSQFQTSVAFTGTTPPAPSELSCFRRRSTYWWTTSSWSRRARALKACESVLLCSAWTTGSRTLTMRGSSDSYHLFLRNLFLPWVTWPYISRYDCGVEKDRELGPTRITSPGQGGQSVAAPDRGEANTPYFRWSSVTMKHCRPVKGSNICQSGVTAAILGPGYLARGWKKRRCAHFARTYIVSCRDYQLEPMIARVDGRHSQWRVQADRRCLETES